MHVTGSQADSVTMTDVLPTGLIPSTVVFVSGIAGIVTGHTITWVLGAVPMGDVTVSFTVQVDMGVEADSILRNTGHATSPSAAPVEAWADLKVKGDIQVTMAVYNEAGEVVRRFPAKYLSKTVDSLNLSSNGVISTVGDSVTISWGGGRVLDTWDGTNNNGQLVANGAYYVKVDNVDSYGTTTSVTKFLTVARVVSDVGLTVYNHAGEAVRHLAETYSGVIDNITQARLTASVISPTNGTSEGVSMTAVMSGSLLLGIWDGRNDQGRIVNNGQYYIEVKVADGKGDHATVDLPVAVLAPWDGGKVIVKPNLLTPEKPIGIIDGGVAGGTVKVKVFSLTGGVVESLNGVPGSGVVQLNSTGLTSGMYILLGQVKNADGTVGGNFRTKVMVVK
jgi:flagellar hook assembly protein FlgD